MRTTEMKHRVEVDADGRVSVSVGARAIGKSRRFVLDLIERGLLDAYEVGGPKETPWKKVNLEELKAARDRATLYIPKGFTRADVLKKRREFSSRRIDPAVANW